jgi:hypothetical protein
MKNLILLILVTVFTGCSTTVIIEHDFEEVKKSIKNVIKPPKVEKTDGIKLSLRELRDFKETHSKDYFNVSFYEGVHKRDYLSPRKTNIELKKLSEKQSELKINCTKDELLSPFTKREESREKKWLNKIKDDLTNGST